MKDTMLLDKEKNKEEKRKKNRIFFKIGVFSVRQQLCSNPWSHEILLHAVKMDLKVQDWTIVSWVYLTESILFYLFLSHFLGVTFDFTEERSPQALYGNSFTLLPTHVVSPFSLATSGCSLLTLLWFYGKRVEFLLVSLKQKKCIII